jgi:hypothetical protein
MIAETAIAIVALYSALACATVVPPPGAPAGVQPVATVPTPPPRPVQRPAWDFLGICTALNERGVQTYPSLNPK